MRRNRSACMAAALGLLLVLPNAGCVAKRVILPSQRAPASRASVDAVGHVTVSPPLFTPLDEVVGGDKRLKFGDLRKESEIAARLEKPSFGSDEVRYSLLEAALAAHFTGGRVSVVDRKRTGTEGAKDEDGNEITPGESRERTRTFETPEVPDAPDVPQVPEKVMEKLLKLLERSDQKYVLPPDELATLVAANKTYMVNLEEYYNVEGFDFRRGLSQAYVPYKMHFTVTAEPGWFSKFNQYDAIVEVRAKLGAYQDEHGEDSCKLLNRTPPENAPPDLIFLSVSPLETAQTVREFTSQLEQVALAAEAAGTATQSLALRAQLRSLVATARRLEGLRAHRTLAVGYPRHDRVRIRFQAPRAATREGRDLQTRSRVLTAIVLIRNREAGNAYSLSKQVRRVDELKMRIAELESSSQDFDEATADLYFALEPSSGKFTNLHNISGGILGGDAEVALRNRYRGELKALQQSTKTRIGSILDGTVDPDGGQGPDAGELQRLFVSSILNEKEMVPLGVARGATERIRLLAGSKSSEQVETRELASAYLRWIEARNSMDVAARKIGRERAHIVEITQSGTDASKAEKDQSKTCAGEVEAQIQCLKGLVSKNEQRLRCIMHGRPCELTVDGYFSPTVYDTSGGWNPPRQTPFGLTRSADRLCAHECSPCGGGPAGCCHPCYPVTPITTWIPPWLGPINIPLEITSAQGFYRLPLASLEKLAGELRIAETKHKTAQAAHAKAGTALAAAKKADASGWQGIESAQALLAVRAAQAADAKAAYGKDPLNKALKTAAAAAEQARVAQAKEVEAVKAASPKLYLALYKEEKAKKAVGPTKNVLEVAQKALASKRAQLIANGKAVVALKLNSAPYHIDQVRGVPVRTKLFGRILGLSEAGCEPDSDASCSGARNCANGSFCELPTGAEQFGLIEVDEIDLSFAAMAAGSASASYRTIHAWVQLVLVDNSREVEQLRIRDHALETYVVRVPISPRIDLPTAVGAAAASDAAKAKPGSEQASELKLEDVTLKFGKPAASN